jgi:Na+-driven multidrug efflux pump
LFNTSMGVYGYWAGLTFGLFLAAGATGTRLYFTTRVKLNELVRGELNFDRR